MYVLIETKKKKKIRKKTKKSEKNESTLYSCAPSDKHVRQCISDPGESKAFLFKSGSTSLESCWKIRPRPQLPFRREFKSEESEPREGLGKEGRADYANLELFEDNG